jgi:hypothetical protein
MRYVTAAARSGRSVRASSPSASVQGIVINDLETAGTGDALPAGWSHFPAAGDWYQVAYEDNFPAQGDYDFNDAVVAYRYKLGLNAQGRVIRVELEPYLVAEGAWFTLHWNFRLPVTAAGLVECGRQRPGTSATEPCTASFAGHVLEVRVYDATDNSHRYISSEPSWASNALAWAPRTLGAYGKVVCLDGAVDTTAIGTSDPWL